MTRRNSPRIEQLGALATTRARLALQARTVEEEFGLPVPQRTIGNPRPTAPKPPPPPAPPSQSEMRGMETSEAIAAVVAPLRAKQAKQQKSSKEDLFDFQLRSFSLPKFERQYMFAKEALGRYWKFDFANIEYKIAVEIEGLVVRKIGGETVVTGRHATITGMRDDMIKYASAAVLGWTVLRFEQGQTKSGEAIDFTQRLLHAKGWRR